MRIANKWETKFIKEAKFWAESSKDPSTKVGAVLFHEERRSIVVTGYNGFPRECDDSPRLYSDKVRKYPRVVHAEANAIANAAFQGKSTADTVLAITHHPCADCAGLIIQAGIKKIIYEGTDDDMARHNSEEATKLFTEAGISITPLKLSEE